MKPSSFRLLVLAAALAALTAALTSCKTADDYFTGTASGAQAAEVRGAVRITDGSKQWRTLRTGQTVAVENLIQTAIESAADIFVPAPGGANARVLMQSDTVLAVQALPSAAANELRLDLRLGWLTLTSSPGPDSPVCEITCAHGLVGARGAAFNVTAEGRVKVIAGTVVVKPLGDQPAHTVGAGMQYDPQSGQVSAAPPGPAVERPVAPNSNPRVVQPTRPSANPFPWIERPR